MSSHSRLIGLDFIRGVAAVMVMLQHSFEATGNATGWFDPYHGLVNLGQAGVVAFFLVSGFVIPMSIEKTGSQLAFWTGRCFRIYPMYAFAFMVSVLFMDGSLDLKTVLSHAVFLQEFVSGVNNQVPNSWTLSLELVWYIAVSFLFAVGLHRRTDLVFLVSLALAILVGIGAWQSTAIPVGRFSMLLS